MLTEDPRVDVIIKNPLATRELNGRTYTDLSNQDTIDLEISVTSRNKRVAEDFSQHPTLAIEAFALSGEAWNQRTKVRVETRSEHYAIRAGLPKAFLSIMLPMEEKRYRKKIEKQVDTLLRLGRTSGLMGSHFEEKLMMNERGFIAELQEMLLENEPGLYELSVIYQNNLPGYWHGAARSRPLLLNILNQGSHLDPPTMPFERF